MENGSTPTNVISMTSRQNLMPAQVRAIIMGQYVESKAQEHTPEMFVQSLEKRLLGDMAMLCAKTVKEFLSETFGDKK